ncbi:hypothetical protein FB451DRAFT_1181078 [Mycena latifolia]|nr:hypothetical protein FB451DRAFT_1181078 [Mycena latifolia]
MFVGRGGKSRSRPSPALWPKSAEWAQDQDPPKCTKCGERVGGLLLSVKLEQAVFPTFAKNSSKMQSLDLEDVDQLQVLVDDDRSFILLQMLSIGFYDAENYDLRDDSEMIPIQIFSNSPLLCKVSLSNAPPAFVSIPGYQLSKFTGKTHSLDDCLEVLHLSHGLHLLATFFFDDCDDEANVTPLTHSNLLFLNPRLSN